MAFARVSGSHASQAFANSASARTVAYGGALTNGSLLIVVVSTFNASITVTVADGTNGSYTQAGTYATDPDAIISHWFVKNTGTATPTVTVTPSASAYMSISLDQFTGNAASSIHRATTEDLVDDVGLTAAVTGSVSATAGDLVIASIGDAQSTTYTSVNAPFTISTNIPTTGSDEGLVTAYDLSASGSEACTFNCTSISIHAGTIISAFKPLALTFKAAFAQQANQ